MKNKNKLLDPWIHPITGFKIYTAAQLKSQRETRARESKRRRIDKQKTKTPLI